MGIWKDKTRGDYVYRFEHQKANYTGRGFQTRREAAAARAERRKEIKEQSKLIRPVMGFREASSAYLDFSERKHVSDVYKYKKLTIKEFLAMHGDLPVTEIDPMHITNYLKTLKTNSVYNARRKDLSATFEWIIKNYKLNMENPCIGIEKMPHAPKDKQIPTAEEVTSLILAAAPGDEQDIIMCCIHLSGRIDEILRLKWQSDINFEKRIVILRTRKRAGGVFEPDSMPMNQDLYDILWDRYQNRNSDKWVFYNKKTEDRYYHRPKMMASLCKRAGIASIGESQRKISKGPNKGKYKKVNLYYGFHSLRHFVPSILMDQQKVGLKTLQGLLRHKNLRTTQIYVQPVDESVRTAMTEFEGKFTPKNANPQPLAATINKKGAS